MRQKLLEVQKLLGKKTLVYAVWMFQATVDIDAVAVALLFQAKVTIGVDLRDWFSGATDADLIQW